MTQILRSYNNYTNGKFFVKPRVPNKVEGYCKLTNVVTNRIQIFTIFRKFRTFENLAILKILKL